MLLVEVLCKLNVYLATLLDIPVSPVTLLISIFFLFAGKDSYFFPANL